MRFEVVNNKNMVVMNTTSMLCIPNKTEINIMIGAGYKFKLNGKNLTRNKIKEFIQTANEK